uniref:NADH-ubiquinone oxidoreductase chain 6 n=1 Tax=Teispes insularis TaxID=2547840 RepID=A0A6H0N4K8_9CUCU|nr:NADH dehydrogenase subunit 6 [Teispes insularis]
MTMSFMAISMAILTILFMFLSHPLSFGMILLAQTVTIAVTTGMMNYNFWFSYILFLVMVGGMLILFIYMTSVASNEKFKLSPKMIILTLTMMIMSIPIMFMDQMFSNMSKFNNELINNQVYVYNNDISLSKFMNMPLNFNLILIIVYLLITLIMVVKITEIRHGPLRQKF